MFAPAFPRAFTLIELLVVIAIIAKVQALFKPVKNIGHIEGLAQNNELAHGIA